MFDEDAIRDLERRAGDAWPPFRQADLEGWRLRFSEGASRRANSVLALEETGDSPLALRIDAAEAWYRTRGQPCRFQISGAVQPRGLDAELERRGYLIEGRTLVMTAPLAAIRANLEAPRPGNGMRLFNGPTGGWLQVFGDGIADDRERAQRCRLAEGLPSPRAYAVADVTGYAAAVGAAVRSDPWVMILCMATRQRFRRRHLAERVLAALAAWADSGGGATKAFLQVEAENEAALALYHKAGFQAAHTYYYRSQQLPAEDA